MAYRYQHADGLKCDDAAAWAGQGFHVRRLCERVREPWSTQMYLPMPDGRTTLADFFSPQVNSVEKMFLTGKAAYPVERTLLTTGLTAAGVESLFREQKRYETPHLAIHYQPTKESTYWRT